MRPELRESFTAGQDRLTFGVVCKPLHPLDGGTMLQVSDLAKRNVAHGVGPGSYRPLEKRKHSRGRKLANQKTERSLPKAVRLGADPLTLEGDRLHEREAFFAEMPSGREADFWRRVGKAPGGGLIRGEAMVANEQIDGGGPHLCVVHALFLRPLAGLERSEVFEEK